MRYARNYVSGLNISNIDKDSMHNTGCPFCDNECETVQGHKFTKKDMLELIVIFLSLILGCLAIGYVFYSMGELAYDTVRELYIEMQKYKN